MGWLQGASRAGGPGFLGSVPRQGQSREGRVTRERGQVPRPPTWVCGGRTGAWAGAGGWRAELWVGEGSRALRRVRDEGRARVPVSRQSRVGAP